MPRSCAPTRERRRPQKIMNRAVTRIRFQKKPLAARNAHLEPLSKKTPGTTSRCARGLASFSAAASTNCEIAPSSANGWARLHRFNASWTALTSHLYGTVTSQVTCFAPCASIEVDGGHEVSRLAAEAHPQRRQLAAFDLHQSVNRLIHSKNHDATLPA